MAQLMLHREVLKTFGRLPAKAQKRVYELIREFEANSTQASLHLEPVHGARDPKVRSARLGDDYRAIVIAPQQGDVFLLMHVDHHDEAYRWCANKQFEAHGALGTLQVFDVVETTAALEQRQPPSPPSRQRYVLDDFSDPELYQAGVPQALIPAVRAVRNDDAFEQLADYLPPEAAQVLYAMAAGMSLDEALAEMLNVEATEQIRPAGPGDFSHLARTSGMNLVLVEGEEHLKEILSEDIEAWRIFLHPYQRKLVEWNVNGPMKIIGAAGTGKTVALMHRAAWLARGLADRERILLTTFTTNLSVTIQGLMERLAPELHRRIEITNLHQLARTICLRAGWRGRIAESEDRQAVWEALLSQNEFAQLPLERHQVVEEYDQIIDKAGIDNEDDYLTVVRSGRPRLSRPQRRQLWKAFAAFQRQLARRDLLTFEGVVHQARLAVEQGKFPRYRHVLVDELQDCGLEALRLLAALSPAGQTNPLCLVGDGHQRLYNPLPIPLSRAGIDVRGRSRRLKINYRTSEQIRRWALGLLEGLAVDDLDGGTVDTRGDRSVFRGPEPQTVAYQDLEQAGAAVVQWVQRLLAAGLESHEICFTPDCPQIVSALEAAGVRTLPLKARQRDPGQEEQGVRYGTKKRIKGLEFRAVAVVLEQEAGPADSRRFENYVAATRAREHLLVLTSAPT